MTALLVVGGAGPVSASTPAKANPALVSGLNKLSADAYSNIEARSVPPYCYCFMPPYDDEPDVVAAYPELKSLVSMQNLAFHQQDYIANYAVVDASIAVEAANKEDVGSVLADDYRFGSEPSSATKAACAAKSPAETCLRNSVQIMVTYANLLVREIKIYTQRSVAWANTQYNAQLAHCEAWAAKQTPKQTCAHGGPATAFADYYTTPKIEKAISTYNTFDAVAQVVAKLAL